MKDAASKRGRKPYAPDAATRRRVSIWAAGGVAHQEIADGLEMSRTTLYKHFASELSRGAIERRAEVIEALYKQAKKGNVSAAKTFLAATPADIPGYGLPAEQSGEHAAETAAPAKQASTVPEGKKERANAEAKVAQIGTDWESLLSPPSLRQ